MTANRTIGIRRLAAELGISIGTVSRALNDRTDVNSQTRARVREAAERLGYVANHSGRSLRQGSTGTVGVLWRVSESLETHGDPFSVALFDGMQTELAAQGRDLVLLMTQPHEQLDRVRRVVERRMVDALILPWTEIDDPRLDHVAAQRFPFVALGRSRSGGDHAWIDLDFETAGRTTIERLAGLGHRHIGLMASSRELMQGAVLTEACQAALAALGLPPAAVVPDSLTEAGGYLASAALMERHPRPTALIANSERMAVGAYRLAAERGFVVGQDVAVIAIASDNALCRYLSPSLTCFDPAPFSLGRRLAEVALDQLVAPLTRKTEQLWPMRLIERESDGAARPNV
ncbi:LacI family DNA-binding transcriptional regulator [Lichenifustis flavocetrariae]|uniref:LacI family transcriptional regulator n=1 Tax=Lichenifustis flavocetrariae TaxID=2949735 RepID=A0AA41YUL4_9HYPH|nr:LacI family DNA-binding transcriptional regulator [Lichenifustis flavocetrariae]MCW6507481.1 LacI family transcriptional regulator [Lichenifustis flavocetrariae]